MKVLAINTSPRPAGNTAAALNAVLQVAKDAGIDTELYQMGGKVYAGCRACSACKQLGGCCVNNSDGMNEIIQKMLQADAILIGSPTYFSNVTTECKALIDRVGCTCRNGGFLLKGKLGAAVVAQRKAGCNIAFAAINFLFAANQMPIVTSSYWNMTQSAALGDFANDAEGQKTMQVLGENLVELLQKLHA